MTGHEVIHQAGADGRQCVLCGSRIAGEGFRYPPGAHVVVADRDPGGSWLSKRQPTCRYEREACP